MQLSERLQFLKDQYMFIKWIGGSEYAKLANVGRDFYEFQIMDIDTMEYQETVFIQHNLLMEVVTGGTDIARIVAEVSSKLSD